MRDLARAQSAMKQRYARKPQARGPRTPKLERGVYVAPVRRRSKVCDFAELQQLLFAYLRSPKTKATDFHKLLEIGTRYGLVLENICPPQSEKETETGPDVRVGESQVSLKEVLRLEREQRSRITKEREKNEQ
jgi:hypothetical protein